MYDQDEFHIQSIQPFIVLETHQFFQRIVGARGISHFWTFKGHRDAQVPFIADTCSNIIFSFGKNQCDARFLAGNVKPHDFFIEEGVEYFGIRFLPGENPCYKNQVVHDLVGKEISLEFFTDLHLIHEKVSRAQTFEERISAFNEEYEKLYQDNPSGQQKLFRQFTRLIVDKKGLLKISQLVVLTGYSARYINQIFEEFLGMSAKQFCSVVRLQMILNEMNRGNVKALSTLASDYGFYDMAHFIHDFKDYTGKTPGDYFNCVQTAGYSRSVIDV